MLKLNNVFTCNICGTKLKSYNWLSRHRIKEHNISAEYTAIEYVYGGNRPICNNSSCNNYTKYVDSRFQNYCSKSCKHQVLGKINSIKLSGSHRTESTKLKIANYFKGKSYELLYGKNKSDDIKKRKSGLNHPLYGKSFRLKLIQKHGEEWYNNFILRRNQFVSEIRLSTSIYDRNSIISYYRLVRKVTELQPLHLLENSDMRGSILQNGYHLDHIFPVYAGYMYNIPPNMIGDISNLRFIPALDNIRKRCKILHIPNMIRTFLIENNTNVPEFIL